VTLTQVSTTTEEPDTPEEHQGLLLLFATGAIPSVEEDLEEELEEEQAGEDEVIKVLGALFSILDMSCDVPHSWEE
jgi:hypothetical protein